MNRLCLKCGVPLRDENWYPSAKRTHNYICKDCKRKSVVPEKNRKIVKEWRKKNPERRRLQGVQYNRRLKEAVLTHYSHGPPSCHCCGEDEVMFLTLDHVNKVDPIEPKIRNRNRGGTLLYRWLRKNHYPTNIRLDVLCFNCNCAKGILGYCPHAKKKEREELTPLIT